MMSFLWTGLLEVSILFACLNRQTDALAAAALAGAKAGVELSITLAGVLCLWSGVSRVMERAGLTQGLARLLAPLLRRLYPTADTQTRAAISANLSANLLGLGNAATPPGIQAARLLHQASGGLAATDDMCLLIVVNTASVQLIPATVAALRQNAGAAHAFDLLPAVWLTSLASVCAGVAAARLLGRLWRRMGW